MKKIEIITRAEKLEDLKDALNEIEVYGMTVYSVMGCGKQKGFKEYYRGSELNINLLHKIKIDTVVSEPFVEKVVEAAIRVCKTGKVGDGKIFISKIEEAVRLRTGERGEIVL